MIQDNSEPRDLFTSIQELRVKALRRLPIATTEKQIASMMWALINTMDLKVHPDLVYIMNLKRK